MHDRTNVPNPHQDTLRYGKLDLNELYQRVMEDVGNYKCKKSIAITHCNEFRMDEYKFEKLFLGWNIYKSDGETHNSIKETKLWNGLRGCLALKNRLLLCVICSYAGRSRIQ